MFGIGNIIPFSKGREKEAETAPPQEYAAERIIEMVADTTQLASAIEAYVTLKDHIGLGGKTANDEMLLKQKKQKITQVLAEGGMKLEYRPSPYNDMVDESLEHFVELYIETYHSDSDKKSV